MTYLHMAARMRAEDHILYLGLCAFAPLRLCAFCALWSPCGRRRAGAPGLCLKDVGYCWLITYYRLEVGGWRLEVGDWGLGIGDWGLGIGDWRLEIGDYRL